MKAHPPPRARAKAKADKETQTSLTISPNDQRRRIEEGKKKTTTWQERHHPPQLLGRNREAVGCDGRGFVGDRAGCSRGPGTFAIIANNCQGTGRCPDPRWWASTPDGGDHRGRTGVRLVVLQRLNQLSSLSSLPFLLLLQWLNRPAPAMKTNKTMKAMENEACQEPARLPPLRPEQGY